MRGQDLACGCRVTLELSPDDAQPEGDRDEPLLSAVVQVALEPPALGVADLHDARSRSGQLLVGVGVGQCLRDEVGEVAEPLLETFAQRLVRRRRRRQHTPKPAADADRRRYAGSVADASHGGRERPVHLLVALHALRLAAADHLRDEGVAVEVELRADRKARRAVLAPGADDGRRARSVELHHVRPGEAQQSPDLFGHLLEDSAGRRLAGDKRRDPAQCRLFVGERTLSRLGARQRACDACALRGHRGQDERGDRRRWR